MGKFRNGLTGLLGALLLASGCGRTDYSARTERSQRDNEAKSIFSKRYHWDSGKKYETTGNYIATGLKTISSANGGEQFVFGKGTDRERTAEVDPLSFVEKDVVRCQADFSVIDGYKMLRSRWWVALDGDVSLAPLGRGNNLVENIDAKDREEVSTFAKKSGQLFRRVCRVYQIYPTKEEMEEEKSRFKIIYKPSRFDSSRSQLLSFFEYGAGGSPETEVRMCSVLKIVRTSEDGKEIVEHIVIPQVLFPSIPEWMHTEWGSGDEWAREDGSGEVIGSWSRARIDNVRPGREKNVYFFMTENKNGKLFCQSDEGSQFVFESVGKNRMVRTILPSKEKNGLKKINVK